MKHATRLFFFLFLISNIDGQIPVWNVQPETPSLSLSPQGSLQFRGDHFLFYRQKTITQLDQLGTVTAAVKNPIVNSANGYGEFIIEKKDSQTGKPYFLLSYSKIGAPSIHISEYYPGQGFTHDTILDEEYNASAAYPYLALNDSVIFILGKKYFRQITHHSNHSVVVDWQKLNTIASPTGGVLTANSIIGISSGHIFALDFSGNLLWDNGASGNLTHIQKSGDNFLACTRTPSAPYAAAIIKFSADGTVLWNKSFSDQAYEFLLAETDGNITVTGRSDSSTVVMHYLDQNGNTIWRKTYQTGIGAAVLRTPDGGYLLAALTNARYSFIKTDYLGITTPVKTGPYPGQRQIENSLLSSVFFPSATLFFNDVESRFFVPKEDLTTLFFAAAPWLGGYDQDSVLHFAASTYPNDGRSDYRPGLLQAPTADFNRVWSISRSAIENLQQDWLDNGVINQPVPYDILTWPAKGNQDFSDNLDFSETSTDKNLLPAPFVDINGDGKYSIYDGDYPRIKGDHMAWWVLTDDTLHSRTYSVPFLVDLAVSAYIYDCAANEKIDQSLFVDFEFINRSTNSYTNMFAGIWSDPDLGCAYDDYIGSLPEENAFYVYNQDPEDGQVGSTCPGGTPTFGSEVPVGSIAFTNVALDKFNYYNNGSGTPPPPYNTTDPSNAEEYNNYLTGRLLDGTLPTYNGQPIDFSFPDNPADLTGNSMCASSLAPGDRRVIGIHGPFSFAPSDTFRLSVAFTYHPNIPLPCPDIFGTVKNDLAELHALVNSGALEAPQYLLSNVQLEIGQSVLLNATVPGATNYIWSNGATTATINVTQPGTYSVTITRSTGCNTTETVLVKSTVPTHELNWLDHLSVFPNPGAGQFKVEVLGAAQKDLEFALYNSLGQLVQRQIVDFQSGILNQTFDYTRFPSGIYNLCVKSGEKTQYVKLVLQR